MEKSRYTPRRVAASTFAISTFPSIRLVRSTADRRATSSFSGSDFALRVEAVLYSLLFARCATLAAGKACKYGFTFAYSTLSTKNHLCSSWDQLLPTGTLGGSSAGGGGPFCKRNALPRPICIAPKSRYSSLNSPAEVGVIAGVGGFENSVMTS